MLLVAEQSIVKKRTNDAVSTIRSFYYALSSSNLAQRDRHK